jgi:release factor glutamine methyltransferase
MNRRDVLKRARELLTENHIEDADWEAEILLRDTLKIDRVHLYTDPVHILTPRQEAAFWEKIERRICGEPSAYIIGHREFYGLDFAVGDDVLIPRPETEMLIDRAIEIARDMAAPVIVDVGTGCGAIAISVAVNVPAAHIYAIDISAAALEVAKENCRRHNLDNRITLLNGELLRPLTVPVDIIVANLPYVKTDDLPTVNTTGFEPRLALDGGAEGLDVIRSLCNQSVKILKPGGSLLLEIGFGQGGAVKEILAGLFPAASVEITADYAKIDRLVTMTLSLLQQEQ